MQNGQTGDAYVLTSTDTAPCGYILATLEQTIQRQLTPEQLLEYILEVQVVEGPRRRTRSGCAMTETTYVSSILPLPRSLGRRRRATILTM